MITIEQLITRIEQRQPVLNKDDLSAEQLCLKLEGIGNLTTANSQQLSFLANPHWDPMLRPLDGRDAAVQDYVASDPRFAEFFQRVRDLVLFTLPAHLEEGKAHLAIGFGCTGGQHRSVTMAEKMADALAKAGWQVSIRHRELERREKAPAPADDGLVEAPRAARAQGQTAVRGGAN